MLIWSWNPLFVAFFIFLIDFVAILVIRKFIEKKVYLTRWWTYRYGDSICLPVYGFCTAVIFNTAVSIPSLYQQTWWHICILVFGYSTMLIAETLHVKNKIYTLKQQFEPSQLYHSLIFGFMFYLVMSTLPVVLLIHEPIWATVGALGAVLGFVVAAIKDFVFDSFLPEKNT